MWTIRSTALLFRDQFSVEATLEKKVLTRHKAQYSALAKGILPRGLGGTLDNRLE